MELEQLVDELFARSDAELFIILHAMAEYAIHGTLPEAEYERAA